MLDLKQISDRIEIGDLLTEYTCAIDSGEWDRLDNVFVPQARIDYTASGGIVGDFAEVKPWLAKMLPHFANRQHVIGQIEVTLDGDTANVVAYFLNPMVMKEKDGSERLWEFGGLYHHQLIRTEQGWRSRELVEEIIWRRTAR
ncbi:MAG TPA: nuclear transport factor 2 family protein [Kineosporiaceae bacterium]|nr:nuclear transport factor 2 family protein [Kineosporiaceae bacterium]